MIDTKSPRRGITELRYIDPRKIRKVIEMERPKDKQFVDPRTMESNLAPKSAEYYVYNPKGLRAAEKLLASRLLLMLLPSPIVV